MKKLFKVILSALLALTMCLPFVGCGPQGVDGKVTIVYYNSAQEIIPALVANKIDTALLAEPAATTARNNEKTGIAATLDLQSVYGGGYPQAVLVMKNSVAEDKAFVDAFIAALKGNDEYLKSAENIAAACEAINEISGVQDSGQTGLNPKQMTLQVVENLNIKFIAASAEKENVKNYINGLKSIQSEAVGELADDFFYDGSSTEGDYSQNSYKLFVPEGAPSLALGQLVVENKTFGRNLNYNVVSASVIGAKILQEGDVGILPVNAASKLFGSGEKFKLMGVITHGNLFVLSKDANVQKVTDLIGKTVAVAGKGNFMDLTLRLILDNNNIKYNNEG